MVDMPENKNSKQSSKEGAYKVASESNSPEPPDGGSNRKASSGGSPPGDGNNQRAPGPDGPDGPDQSTNRRDEKPEVPLRVELASETNAPKDLYLLEGGVRGPDYQLVDRHGKAVNFETDQTILLGRKDDSEFNYSSVVSWEHVSIEVSETGSVTLSDLDSTNGTRIDQDIPDEIAAMSNTSMIPLNKMKAKVIEAGEKRLYCDTTNSPPLLIDPEGCEMDGNNLMIPEEAAVPITERTMVGRESPNRDVRALFDDEEDNTVSREHFTIEPDSENGVKINDADSTNGTTTHSRGFEAMADDFPRSQAIQTKRKMDELNEFYTSLQDKIHNAKEKKELKPFLNQLETRGQAIAESLRHGKVEEALERSKAAIDKKDQIKGRLERKEGVVAPA